MYPNRNERVKRGKRLKSEAVIGIPDKMITDTTGAHAPLCGVPTAVTYRDLGTWR